MPAIRTAKKPPATTVRSQQARSQRTEQALLDAALSLFRERGVDAVTVGDIAAAAGVAPATIYRRFGDKEGLLKEAFRRFTASALQMLDWLPPAKAQRSFVSLVADMTRFVLQFSQSNQKFLESAYAKALVDDDYAAALVELRSRTFAALKNHVMQHAGQIGHPQPEIAVDFALRQAMAMLSARLQAGKLEVGAGAVTGAGAGAADASDAQFVRELMRSMLSYLQVPFTAAAIDKALTARGI